MKFESYLAEPLPFRELLEPLLAELDRPMIFDIGACEGYFAIDPSRRRAGFRGVVTGTEGAAAVEEIKREL